MARIKRQKLNSEGRAYLAALVESSDDAIISKDLKGHITFWNRAAEGIFGYTAEEVTGSHIGLLLPPDLVDEENSILGKIRAGERFEPYQTIHRTKDGRLVNVSITVSPICNVKGEIIGASRIARDITKQKRMEYELLENSRRRDEFIAHMSHELRSPMNAVTGLAQILSMSQSLSAQEREFIKTLQQSVDNMTALLNELLAFSRGEQTGQPDKFIETAAPQARASRKDILLVEDYQPNIIVATAMFDRMGYSYDLARNGLEALQKFQDGRYDVVLMDIQMDTMDGFESAMRIRDYEKDSGRKATPIIAVTAHVLEQDKGKCLEAGMDGFIPKPFTMDILEETLKQHISVAA